MAIARRLKDDTVDLRIEDRLTRVATLVDSTSGLSLRHLRSFLDRECADDPALRAEVERLIVERETFVDPRRNVPSHSASLAKDDIVAGRYRITRLIGRGGMGEVYEADDRLLKERVALKTLRGDLAGRESLLQRFQEEILLARKVTHPNVCRIYEVGMHEAPGHAPLLFFAMELLEGDTLAARTREGPLTRAEAFPLAVQMADGLQAAHTAGIVHADFKSGNVVLVPTPKGTRAVITDFGLARLDPTRISVDETRTLDEIRLAGTLAYMSPEQLRGERITSASDVYSFGVVLFEMATGSLPFDERDLIRAAILKASGDPLPVRAKVPDIDHRWEAAIDRCLQKDPERRFSSAGAIAAWFKERHWFEARRWTAPEWIGAAAIFVLSLALLTAAWLWGTRPYVPLPEARAAYEQGMKALHSMTYETARQAFERAVVADPKFALAHAGLARAYDELDYSDRAKDSVLRALAAAEETRLTADDERRLRATQFAVSRDYARAAPLFREMEEAASDREKPAAALETGWLAQQMEDSAGARAAFERALAFDASYPAARLRLGFMLGRQSGKDDLALAAFTEAEELYRSDGDDEGVTETLLHRANLLHRRGRDPEALVVLGKALAVARTVGNRYQEIRLLLLEGTAFRDSSNFARAAEFAQQAYDLATTENMDNLATNSLIDLGNVHLLKGDIRTAEPILQRGLDSARRSKVRRTEARAQMALASLLEQDHRPEEARPLIESGLSFYRKAGYQRETIQTAIVLGGVLRQLGQHDEGIRVLRDTLPSALKLQDRRVEALLRERIADNLRDQGDWPSALDEYQRVNALYGSGPQSQPTRLAVADLQWRLGQRADAERSLLEVEQFESKARTPRLLASIEVLRGEIAYADGRLDEARHWARLSRSKGPRGAESTLRQATVLESLVLLRTGRTRAGLTAIDEVLHKLEMTKLIGDAARVRLAVADALMMGGDRPQANQLAAAALNYFEPKKIWESSWRARMIAGRTTDLRSDAEAHERAGLVALSHLRTVWPSRTVDHYMERSDIRRLSSDLRSR